MQGSLGKNVEASRKHASGLAVGFWVRDLGFGTGFDVRASGFDFRERCSVLRFGFSGTGLSFRVHDAIPKASGFEFQHPDFKILVSGSWVHTQSTASIPHPTLSLPDVQFSNLGYRVLVSEFGFGCRVQECTESITRPTSRRRAFGFRVSGEVFTRDPGSGFRNPGFLVSESKNKHRGSWANTKRYSRVRPGARCPFHVPLLAPGAARIRVLRERLGAGGAEGGFVDVVEHKLRLGFSVEGL